MTRLLDVGVRVVLGGLLACCGGNSSQGYFVRMEVVGPPEAFTGRTIEVEGVRAREARGRTGHPDQWSTEVTLCTRSRDAFLQRPFRVVVLEGERVLVDHQVERVACQMSPGPPGDEEHDILHLDAHGVLSADFGKDPRTDAACFPPDAPRECAQPQF